MNIVTTARQLGPDSRIRQSFERRLLSRRPRDGRHVSHEAAVEALREISEMVALVGLYRPVRDPIVEPVLHALDAIVGPPEGLEEPADPILIHG